jgi:hypothetical protein
MNTSNNNNGTIVVVDASPDTSITKTEQFDVDFARQLIEDKNIGRVDRDKLKKYFKNRITGNKRAEMWGEMREWLKTASIPNDRYLKSDLIGPMMKPDSRGTIFLESKKDMKSRGLASPDAADAIAVTFAFPVARREGIDRNPRRGYSAAGISTSWLGA